MSKPERNLTGMHANLKPDEVEKVRVLLNTTDMSQAEIARAIGRSQAAVNKIVKQLNTEVKDGIFNVDEFGSNYPF